MKIWMDAYRPHLDHLRRQVVERAAHRVASRVRRVDAPAEVRQLQPSPRTDEEVLGLSEGSTVCVKPAAGTAPHPQQAAQHRREDWVRGQ